MSYYYQDSPRLVAGNINGSVPKGNVATVDRYPAQDLDVVVEPRPRWSWCSTGWAIVAFLCCSSVCGFFGLMCSIFSYVDHKSGDYDRARYKRRCSWACSIIGILLSLLGIVAVVLIIVVYRDELRKNYDWYTY
ncbi:hypothetical protein LSAT2_005722 [Lamellibrachia satsuma]|nr:hypothetical protein LSAT2_005722 [Lamellibrachia satsuma]